MGVGRQILGIWEGLVCNIRTTMFNGVLHCLCLVFIVFLLSLHDD